MHNHDTRAGQTNPVTEGKSVDEVARRKRIAEVRRERRVERERASELIYTEKMEGRYGMSRQWLAVQRMKGGDSGPPWVKIGSRVAYREADVNAWLESRKRSSTSDDAAQS